MSVGERAGEGKRYTRSCVTESIMTNKHMAQAPLNIFRLILADL